MEATDALAAPSSGRGSALAGSLAFATMQRDIVLRWIAQLAAIIARLLRRDPKLSLELARQYLEEAEAQTLGPLGPLVAKLTRRAPRTCSTTHTGSTAIA
ncbi:MAG: hypothetical protein R2909_06535 [Gemmatimonadales bacterium]